MSDNAKWFLRNVLVPSAIGGVALREKTKSMLIRMVHQLRVEVRLLGKKLSENGLIPDESLLYHLSVWEIKQLLEGENVPVILQKAKKRQRLYPEWNNLTFEENQRGLIKPLNEGEDEEFEVTDGAVTGTPGSRGIYEGPARVITRLEEAKTIEKGDILITVSTDIGWSPYFPLVGAVVTELGGLISHGAVVAREYGLPCVVGARGATKAFNTGDRVRVDGRHGVVSKVE